MGSTPKLLQVTCAFMGLVGLAIAPYCYGQSPDASPADSVEAMVLRTYEIGDLVFAVPDYALEPSRGIRAVESSGAFGGGGGGRGFAGGGMVGGRGEGDVRPASNPAPVTVDSIRDVIVTTVAPNSWSVNGGGDAHVAPLGTTLVVLQTAEAQEAIGQLLGSLRDGSASRRSMTIDARWLLLDSDGLERLKVTGDDGESTIDRQVLAEFTREPTSLRGFISCFSGQSVFLTSGTVRSNVTSYIPVVGSIEPPKPEVMFASQRGDGSLSLVSDEQRSGFSNRSVGYQPVTTTNNFGVQIELRPTRLHPEKAAAVDLRSTITFPVNSSNAGELAAATSDLVPQVDRLAILTQELATTLRVPLGEPVLVGGMTVVAPRQGTAGDATGDPAGMAGGGAAEKPQLYLILEVR